MHICIAYSCTKGNLSDFVVTVSGITVVMGICCLIGGVLVVFLFRGFINQLIMNVSIGCLKELTDKYVTKLVTVNSFYL